MGRAVPATAFDSVPFGDDPWQLTVASEAMRLAHLPAILSLGNGFVGVRGPGGGRDDRRVFLNGVFEKVAIPYHEAAFGYARESDTRLSVADATSPAITVDGVLVGEPIRVELDMRRARRVDYYAAGDVSVVVESIVPMSRRAVAACRIRFPAAHRHRVRVEPRITPPPSGQMPADEAVAYDPRLPPDLVANPWRQTGNVVMPHHLARVDRLDGSGFEVAAACGLGAVQVAGEQASVEAFASYAASRATHPLNEALSELEAARAAGFGALADEQAAWFDRYWRASLAEFADSPRAEQALRFALFQLVQAVGRDGSTSIAAKGQTGEGYEGHVFWDADLYVLPIFAFTYPAIARAMLTWRIAGLGAARENARAMGQTQGALYPWRTIAGRECSSFFPAGSAQYHINADIAYALRTYLQATGDTTVLDEGGAAMLVETARTWLEIGHYDETHGDRFVINRVTGPDEYSALVDNNLYTNMMAADHLRDAARLGSDAGLIADDEAARMRRAANAMYLPFDTARGVYAQDGSFFSNRPWPFAQTPPSDYPLLLNHHPLKIYRHQVAKQADAVLAVALMPGRFELPVRARMVEVYEAVTVHDSTLSASAFAMAAAGVGDMPRAFGYWRTAVLTDLANLFGNTDHGLHMAALAGSWTALAMGFAGLRIVEDAIWFDPIAVTALGRYRFRVWFRGSLLEVAVDEANASYRLIQGPKVRLYHGGRELEVGSDPTDRPLTR